MQCRGKGEELETCATFWDIAACLAVATAHVPGPEVRSKRLQRKAECRSRRRSRRRAQLLQASGVGLAVSLPRLSMPHAMHIPSVVSAGFTTPNAVGFAVLIELHLPRRPAPQDVHGADWCTLCVVKVGCTLLR